MRPAPLNRPSTISAAITMAKVDGIDGDGLNARAGMPTIGGCGATALLPGLLVAQVGEDVLARQRVCEVVVAGGVGLYPGDKLVLVVSCDHCGAPLAGQAEGHVVSSKRGRFDSVDSVCSRVSRPFVACLGVAPVDQDGCDRESDQGVKAEHAEPGPWAQGAGVAMQGEDLTAGLHRDVRVDRVLP